MGMRVMRKKLNIFTLQLSIYYILGKAISIGANADIVKSKREKEIGFVVERWLQFLLHWINAKSARVASHHPAFMSNCLT